MELKEKLQESLKLTTSKSVDPKLIYLLGIFGLLLTVVALWLWFADGGSSGSGSKAASEAAAAQQQMQAPIREVKNLLLDEQVQSLAVRALENPDTTEDLVAYANGRMNSVQSAEVFGENDVIKLRPSQLGANGYALLDLVLSVLEGKKSQMQVHANLQPPVMYDAIAVTSAEEVVGVLVLGLDPAPVITSFQPEFSGQGYLRLVQYNGRQPVSVLKEFGQPPSAGSVPDRLTVPGTMFRIEYPGLQEAVAAGGAPFMMILVVGLLCMAVAFVLYRSNQHWLEEQKAKSAGASVPVPAEAAETAWVPESVHEPDQLDRDADFVDLEQAVEAQAVAEPVVKDEPEPKVEEPPGPPLMHLHYDIAERRRQREAEHEPVELRPEIFRAYDIRGVIDKTLDSGVARNIGQAVGSLVLERDAGPVVIARDGRLSGPYLMEGVIEGVLSTGCDVLDIGAVPTGVLYYAAHEKAAGSGIMITGSHNPPDYNGFKVMVGGDTLHGDAITGLYESIKAGDLKSGQGQLRREDVVADYIERISSDITVEKPMRIVIDCGNGIGGVCAADTLRALGVEVLPMFDEVDGTFPNHHPDPSEPENLQDLIDSVRVMDADLGLAFDGDADRLGVVTLAGNIIFPDRIMMLLALDVLDRVPGATILYDVKCTGHLPKVISEAGGNPVMYKTGHSLMKSKMKEVGSPFAGEMSGHFFFGERWYGVDDGIYAAARLLEILGGTETPPEAILNALPTSYSTPELKVHMEEGENHDFVEAFKASAKFEGAEIHTIDGLRADFEDGWGLVRPSNTTPILVVRFDAETEQALERIKTLFRTQMLELKPDLELPF